MWLARALGSRIAVRIYLVGIAQFAVVAVGFALLMHAERPTSSPLDRHASLVARLVAPLLADRAALQERVALLAEELASCVTVVNGAEQVVASSSSEGCRCPAAPGTTTTFRANGRETFCASAALPGTPLGRVELVPQRLHKRPPMPSDLRVIGFVLLVVGVSAWLLARTLTGPLERLARAARAFGAGEMSARTGIERADELGEVARTFDEMAARVAELMRVEKELLANVSHELRTPLARVRVALDLAAEGDAELARESLADIASDLDELEQIIRDVLITARLNLSEGTASTALPPLHREAVDVRELLEHAASRFRAAHPDRALQVELGAELGSVDADSVLLRRAVENLLENAHKYTESPSKSVELRAHRRERDTPATGRHDPPGRARAPGVEIEVVDQGVGIAPDDLSRVFEPFFRADRSRTRATGGLGLGLALAKRIVDGHRGELRLESAPGQGTRARLWLPSRAAVARRD